MRDDGGRGYGSASGSGEFGSGWEVRVTRPGGGSDSSLMLVWRPWYQSPMGTQKEEWL